LDIAGCEKRFNMRETSGIAPTELLMFNASRYIDGSRIVGEEF
jgi:hypothetical protein